MTMAKEIADHLYDISNHIEDLVEEHKDDIEKSDVPYAKLKVDEFSYDSMLEMMQAMDSGDSSAIEDIDPHLVMSDEETSKEEWNTQDRYQYIIEQVEQSEDYSNIVDILEDRFSDRPQDIREDGIAEEPDPIFLLHRFTREVSTKYLDGEVDDKDIVSLISSFTSEIERPPIEWNPSVYISGVGLNGEEISINDDIILRRTTPEDIEQEVRMDSPWYRMSARPLHANTPTAVMEFETRAQNEEELWEDVTDLISSLRLFKTASVNDLGYNPNPNSPLRNGSPSWKQKHADTPFQYIIEQSEEDELEDFYNYVFPILKEEILSAENEDYLTIAYDRYESSLTDESSPESRLVSAIMALEAMYLTEDEEGELSERLAQRTGLILSLFDNPPIRVYNRIKKAYNIRSNYVHGSKIHEDDREGLSQLEERIAEYARMTIIVHIQLLDQWDKDRFLSKVDNAILDSEARNQFEEDISEHCDFWY